MSVVIENKTELLIRNIAYWIALLPDEPRERFHSWLRRHAEIATGSGCTSLEDFFARLPAERHTFEAFTTMSEVVWQWQRSLKRSTEQ